MGPPEVCTSFSVPGDPKAVCRLLDPVKRSLAYRPSWSSGWRERERVDTRIAAAL